MYFTREISNLHPGNAKIHGLTGQVTVSMHRRPERVPVCSGRVTVCQGLQFPRQNAVLSIKLVVCDLLGQTVTFTGKAVQVKYFDQPIQLNTRIELHVLDGQI